MRFVTKERPPVPPSKVELYAAIRRDARAGMSGRAIEKKYRVGRRQRQAARRRHRPRPEERQGAWVNAGRGWDGFGVGLLGELFGKALVFGAGGVEVVLLARRGCALRRGSLPGR
jgi:hypothetical protein